MYRSTLEILRCPQCKEYMTLQRRAEEDTAEIRFGELACARCDGIYPIEEGILHLASKREVMETYPEMEAQARKGAPFYDFMVRKFVDTLEMQPDKARAEYLERLELVPNAKILDVGIGAGAELIYLWARTTKAQMFGLDISIEMLRRCQGQMNSLNANAQLFLGFAERLPFMDEVFDVVFHTGSINEFKDQRQAMEEMVRVAKPGTRIVVTDEWITHDNIKQPIGQRLVAIFPSLSRDVVPPIDCVPSGMEEVRLDTIWNGYGYCLQFRKP